RSSLRMHVDSHISSVGTILKQEIAKRFSYFQWQVEAKQVMENVRAGFLKQPPFQKWIDCYGHDSRYEHRFPEVNKNVAWTTYPPKMPGNRRPKQPGDSHDNQSTPDCCAGPVSPLARTHRGHLRTFGAL